jgi:hypothetical protein
MELQTRERGKTESGKRTRKTTLHGTSFKAGFHCSMGALESERLGMMKRRIAQKTAIVP